MSDIRVHVGRFKALTRAMLWGVPVLPLGVVTVAIYDGLHSTPSGVSNRLVDYSIALVALPIPLVAIWSLLRAARWLVLSIWPAQVGVFANEHALTFRLGPFGTRAYDAARLDVHYPFELSEEAENRSFEAFLPEEQQIASLLPRLVHPDGPEPLNEVILRFTSGDEATVAAILRPAIKRWRSRTSRSGGTVKHELGRGSGENGTA